jgi:hypothetical protein
MTVVAHRRPHTPPLASPFLEFDLLPGSLLALDHRASHDLEALEERAVLLTIAWPGGRHESIDNNNGPSQT